jgi:hypothetical protein
MIGTWYQGCQPEVVAMSARVSVGASQERAAGPIAEREARSAPGVPVLIAGIVMLVAAIVLLILGIALGPGHPAPASLIVLAGLLALANQLALRGLTQSWPARLA